MDTTALGPTSFKVGQAPWESGASQTPQTGSQTFAVGSAPWETQNQQASAQQPDDQNIVSKFGSAVMGNSTPDQGALFSTNRAQASDNSLGGTAAIAAKTAANIVPDYYRTIVGFPAAVAGQAVDVVKNTAGLFKDSSQQNLLTPQAQAAAKSKGLYTGPQDTGILGTIKTALNNMSSSGTFNMRMQQLKAILPSAATKIYNGDLNGAAQDIANHPFQQIAPFLLALDEGAKAGGSNAVDEAISKTGQMVTKPVGEAMKSGTDYLQGKATEISKNQELLGWEKPTTSTKASYSKANDIFDKASSQGHSIPETLTNNGIKLADNITGSNYDTEATVGKIRDDAIKMSYEGLRPSLQMADYSTPKTPVEEIFKQTISDIKNDRSLPPGTKDAQLAKALKEGRSLKNHYPDGMSLTEMHDEKINYTKNRYSPIGPKSDANAASVDRAFGRTLMKTVETKAPPEIPVHEFNAELSKQFQAADYLESLHGKPVPKGMLSRLANTAGKLVGAIGGKALGGGILATAGGYHIGGMIESMMENLPANMRSTFLDNLQRTNPEAFKAVSDYMGNEKMSQMTRKLLSAGNTIYAPEYKGAGRDKLFSQEEARARLKELGVKGVGPITHVKPENLTPGRVKVVLTSLTGNLKALEGSHYEDVLNNRAQAEMELASINEAINNHPAQPLMKYINRSAQLPESTGYSGRGKFNMKGDEIIGEKTHYKDISEAQKGVEELRGLRQQKESYIRYIKSLPKIKIKR